MVRKINYTIGLALVFIAGFYSCEKQEDFAPVFSASVVETTPTSAKISASISADVELESQGLIYSQDSSLTILTENDYWYGSYYERGIIDLDQLSTQEFNISDLQTATNYYFKLFAVNDGIAKESEAYSFMTDCPGLGCGPAGGVIIWEDGMGGGIEVANSGTYATNWGCLGTNVSTETAVGTGQANTTEIINDCEINTLAEYCENYTQNGYSDYYMPSKDELDLIYSKAVQLAGNPHGLPVYTILSSSQESSDYVYGLNLSSNTTIYASKSYIGYSTIPVRSF